MKKLYSTIMMLAMMVAALSFTACGGDDGGDGNGGGINSNQVYDVLQINGESYACYGFRSPITYSSHWDKTMHSGEILLPCGNLSDAQNGKHNYSYLYAIYLEGNQNLSIGSKFENYSPKIENNMFNRFDYISGSGTVIDKSDRYITVKFDNLTFKNYTLNGTVQLVFDENSDMSHNKDK